MADLTDGRAPDERPRPTPRPRPGTGVRPSPRPRVAGSRRDREEAPIAEARPAATARPATARSERPASATSVRDSAGTGGAAATAGRRPSRTSALVLALLCVAALVAGALLLWQRTNPAYVDPSIFSAARSEVQALYAYDYKDSDGSIKRKLDVLTGDLRDQYKKDLGQGGIIDTYKQVSATTSYQVLDVGLQQVNEAQDTATVVVFGEYVVKSVNTGEQPAPQGSECTVTTGGAQSCTQTVQVRITKVDGDWKINELTLLTTS